MEGERDGDEDGEMNFWRLPFRLPIDPFFRLPFFCSFSSSSNASGPLSPLPRFCFSFIVTFFFFLFSAGWLRLLTPVLIRLTTLFPFRRLLPFLFTLVPTRTPSSSSSS